MASLKELMGLSDELQRHREGKRERRKTEVYTDEKPKEEKKEGEKPALDAKALDKLKAKIIKEGGKKGVEIEGASDMGACTLLPLRRWPDTTILPCCPALLPCRPAPTP